MLREAAVTPNTEAQVTQRLPDLYRDTGDFRNRHILHIAFPTACRQLAEADIRPLDANSRFDPIAEVSCL